MRKHDSGQAREQELNQRKAVQKSIGVAKRILPPHMVAIQLKILIPVGTPTSPVESTKNAFCAEVMPTVNRCGAPIRSG